MIERIYILESVDPVIFYGVNNVNMQLIKTLFPKLRIVARGNVMKVIGDEDESELFLKKIREVEKYCEEFNSLSEDVILDIIKGKAPVITKQENLIIHGMNGKPIVARTENQQRLVKAFEENDLVFATGPAGTGKTFVAIALAVKALQDMVPGAKLKEYMENNVIQIAPLAFMRGRTLNDAVIILDEAQNTTTHQIKMFLTRLGMNAKMIITGDVTQIDLPPTATSGLVQAMQILKGVKGIGKVEFEKKDIVRHKLVQRIVEAYDKFDSNHSKGGSRTVSKEQQEEIKNNINNSQDAR